MNKRELLSHAGEISHQKAIEKSSEEYKKYIYEQKQIEKEQSLKELEQDIKEIKSRK